MKRKVLSLFPLRRTHAMGLAVLALTLGFLAWRELGHAQQPGRPGDFDYYALVLSWSPTHCAEVGDERKDPQCAPQRRYAFVLHGLWPQFARTWPEFCSTGGRTFVPDPVINGMLDIMPSRGLVIHQYRKHGSCSGLAPSEFFALSRKLHDKVRIPQRYQGPDAPITTSPGEIVRDFVAANAGLKPEMLAVGCGRPNRVREVRVCFSREGEFRACGRNEDQDRLCRSKSVVLPPVRGGSGRAGAPPRDGQPSFNAPRGGGSPLPGPRDPGPAPAGERRI